MIEADDQMPVSKIEKSSAGQMRNWASIRPGKRQEQELILLVDDNNTNVNGAVDGVATKRRY